MPRKRIPASGSETLKIERVIPVNKPTQYKYVPIQEKRQQRMAARLALLALVVIGAVIGIYVIFGTNQEVRTDISIPSITSNGSLDGICDDDCKLQNATISQDAQVCRTIFNETKKQECFSLLATTSFDACISLGNYTKKVDCVSTYARTMEDVESCNHLLEENRRDCIVGTDPCYYLEGSEELLCRARVTANYSYCGGNEECIISFARETGSADACSTLSTRVKKNACSSLTLNRDECEHLPLSDEKNACRELYAIQANKSSVCNFISSDTVYAVGCYANFAKQSMNVSMCNRVDLLKRWECYAKYSRETGDLSGCVGIDKFAPIAKQHCFIETGKKYGNPQACEYLTFDPSAREVCFRAAIQDNIALRASACAGLTSEPWSLRCYTNAAQLEGNPDVCNLQENPADISFCRNNYK